MKDLVLKFSRTYNEFKTDIDNRIIELDDENNLVHKMNDGKTYICKFNAKGGVDYYLRKEVA